MKQAQAVEFFLAGRRVTIARFTSQEFVEDRDGKTGSLYSIVSRFQVVLENGKALTAQIKLPKSVVTIEDARRVTPPHGLKFGDRVCVEYTTEELNRYQAVNGTLLRALSVDKLLE